MVVGNQENDLFVSVSSVIYFSYSSCDVSHLVTIGRWCQSICGNVPKQYAYNLMDALFTVEEMGTHCFRENSRTTKPGLDMKRVKLLG